jgi:hypothetical protein
MPLEQNEFKDLHEESNTSETGGGFESSEESTEEVQKATSEMADIANAVLDDIPVSQDQVNKTKDVLKNLVFTDKERGKEELLIPLWTKLEASYVHMKDTLKNYGYQEYLSQLPSAEELRTHVLNLTPIQLHAISKMGKPTVLVCTPDSLAKKVKKLDKKKKHKNQKKTRFWAPPTKEIYWGTPPTQLTIFIIDGQSEMPQLSKELLNTSWGYKYQYMQEAYKREGLKMISASQYAHFAMERLRAYELIKQDNFRKNIKERICRFFGITKAENNPAKGLEMELIDSIDSNTITAFEGGLTKVKHPSGRELEGVPGGEWDQDIYRFCFDMWGATSGLDNLRFRPSVEVWNA